MQFHAPIHVVINKVVGTKNTGHYEAIPFRIKFNKNSLK